MRVLCYLRRSSRPGRSTAATISAALAAMLLAMLTGNLTANPAGPYAAPTTSILKLPANQLTAYEGTAVLEQSVGEDKTTFDFTADALVLTRATEDGSLGLLAARYLKAVDESETFGALERYHVKSSDAELDLDPRGDIVHELGADMIHMLNVYLPWETLPTFAVPAIGEKAESKEKISVLDLALVDAGLTASTVKQGEKLEVTRQLSEGEAPTFDFRGSKANLVLFRQKYVIGPDTGRVEAVESDCAFEIDQDGTKVRLERKVRLKEKSSTDIKGKDAPAWTSLLEDLAAIEKDFRDKKSSEKIAKRLNPFVKSAADTPLAAVSGALEYRLEAFKQFYEATLEGQVLKKVLDNSAPDFKLKDLDGKDVAFRAATAGNKVTLLNFWGYG